MSFKTLFKGSETFINNHRLDSPGGMLEKTVLDGNQNAVLEVSYRYLIILVKSRCTLILKDNNL